RATNNGDELPPPHGAYAKAKDHGLSIAGVGVGRWRASQQKGRPMTTTSPSASRSALEFLAGVGALTTALKNMRSHLSSLARRTNATMRPLPLAAVLALLAGAAIAQQQTSRNERGQITGSSSTSGNVTTFRDRSGRMTGTAERMRDGSVQYRDAMGRLT